MMRRTYNKTACCTWETFTRSRLNKLSAIFAGVLFSVGWWFMIDVHATNPKIIKGKGFYYVPGIVATLAFVTINIVPQSAISEDVYATRGRCARLAAQLVLFIGFFLAFSALIGAFYIYVHDFAMAGLGAKWAGIGILFHNVFVFASALIFKFGVVIEEYL